MYRGTKMPQLNPTKTPPAMTSERGASYCMTCYCFVSRRDHMTHESQHSLINADSAMIALKHNLDANMDNINLYFQKMNEIRSSVKIFEDSHEQCKQSIKAASRELITKIQEHESRILDELDTHRDIEYKRTGLGCNQDKITEAENNLLNLQQLINTVSEQQNGDFLSNYKLHREHINRQMVDFGNVDTILQKVSELRHSVFSPIRCNTSFGTLDIINNKQKKTMFSRKTSLSFPTQPQLRNFGSQSSSEQESDPEEDSTCLTQINTNRYRKFSYQAGGVHNLTMSPDSRKISLQAGVDVQISPQLQRDTIGRVSPKLGPQLSGKWSPLPSDTCSEEEETLDMLWSVEVEGPEVGQINCPSDVCFLPDGTLVVCDRGNKRLQLFNNSGDAVKVIGENKLKPCRVHTNKHGHIVVSDSKENNVSVYDKKGSCQSTLGKKLFKSATLFQAPCGVASKSGKQYVVSDLERNDVKIYSSEGKVLKDLCKDSGECIEFKKPSYITSDNEGRILVSDNLNHCVKVFDAQGKYLFQCVLGSKNNGFDTDSRTNYLKYPNGVCCDTNGDIYVADWGSHTVSHFSHQGEFLSHVLTREDGIYHPAGIAIMGDQLAVCSYSDSHSSVQVFKMSS